MSAYEALIGRICDAAMPVERGDEETVCTECGEHPRKWRHFGDPCEDIECSGIYAAANQEKTP